MNAENKPTPEGRLARTLGQGHFAITAEVTPPVSGGTEKLLAKAEPLRGCADAVNVTDGASARVHMSSLAAAASIAANGIEPVLQLTCRDRNRIAQKSDLLGAAALGIHNLLMLRGDDPSVGDQPDAKPVFDLESGDLLQAAAEMRDRALLPSGREIDTPPRFFLGGADMPIDPPADWRPESLLRKIEAGAQFAQTQFCFDIEITRRYIARLAEHGITDSLYILLGIGPLASARSARWMCDNLFGVIIPDALIDRLDKAADAKAEGIAICAELMQQLADIPGVAGAHLMAPTNPDSIPAAIEASGLLKTRG